MNQFVQRLANYVANEVIIKGLANSRTFQRFAVRTNKQYNDFSKQGTEQLEKTIEELAKQQAAAAQEAGGKPVAAAAASSMSAPPKPPLRGIPGFFSAFFKEIRKDITSGA
jgi:inosine/xanthosine triphosphate pyrophosphatase family protein